METQIDQVIYQVIKQNPNITNDELIREFYWRNYNIVIPKLDGAISFETITRKGRLVREMFHIKGDEDSQKAKIQKEADIKDMIVEAKNNPESIRFEEMKIGGIYW